MFKRMVSKPLLLLIPGIVCGIACSGGCSTGRVSIPDTHELPFKQQGSASNPKQLWSEKLEGKLTDLAHSNCKLRVTNFHLAPPSKEEGRHRLQCNKQEQE